MRKILFFDCETTGLDSRKHDIWQYAAIMTVGGVEVDRIEIECLPIGGEVDPNALKAVGQPVDMFEVKALPKGELGWYEFVAFLEKWIRPKDKLDKAALCGYNIKFDEKFLRSTWSKMKDPYFGSFFTKPSIDVWQLCALELGQEWLSLPNHKLQTVATRILGEGRVRGAQWHDAMVDVEITAEMFNQIYYKRWKSD